MSIVYTGTIDGGLQLQGTNTSFAIELPEGTEFLLLTNMSASAPAWVAFGDETVETSNGNSQADPPVPPGLPILPGDQVALSPGSGTFMALYAAGSVVLNLQYTLSPTSP